MRLQQLTPSKTTTLTIADARSAFMLHQRTSRQTPKTLRYYDYVLDKFGTWLQATNVRTVDDVDANLLRRFILDIEKTLKPNSVRGVFRGVRAFFSFLVNEELLEHDPMKRLKAPKVDKTILEAFTSEDVRKLERATEGKDAEAIRNRALVYLLLDSGLRLAECASLKVGDVDLTTGTMVVLGKGRKQRVSKLGAVALKAFVKYARLRGGDKGDALWIGRKGPMTQAGVAETIERIGKRAGVHAHPHKFRRTCALFMLRSGADIFSVQYLLGHADLAVLRRYLNQNESDITRAHEAHSPVDGLK